MVDRLALGLCREPESRRPSSSVTPHFDLPAGILPFRKATAASRSPRRRYREIFHLPRHVAFGAALVSNVIYAQEIGASLDCHLGPHTFIEQLVEEKEIDPIPMKVSADSVNVYRLRPDQNLTALGFKVRAVFGFSPNDDMFTKKNSEGETPHRVYGVVVMAEKEAVSERVRETGSPATVREVMPLLMTAVACEK